MSSTWIVAAAFLVGCQTATLTTTPCSNELPSADQSRAEAWCSEHVITSGEGRTGDTWLGGSSFRAVVRTPLASLTNPGLGGGGLIDLALWDHEDIIHEITPLFQGGWLQIQETTDNHDSVMHTGIIQCWPGETCPHKGTTASLTWRVGNNKLWVSGPDALLIHPSGSGRVTKDTVQIKDTLLQHDGNMTFDVGGEFTLTDVSWIALSAASTATAPLKEHHKFSSQTSGIIAFEWPTDRSRNHRIDNEQTRTDALDAGVSLIVDSPENDIGDAVTGDGVFVRQGLTSTNSDFTIRSWPWKSNVKLAGHGAISIADLAAQDALNILWGGPGIDRYTVADVAWLDHIDVPGLVTHKPDFVWLDGVPGGIALPSWSAWYRWLDARENIPALGPLTWVPLIDPTRPSATELERGLLEGRGVATSGPNISLIVNNGTIGDEVPQEDSLHIQIQLSDDAAFTHLALIGDGGTQLFRWSPRPTQSYFQTEIQIQTHWVIAVGWNESGSQWAATSPVWVY
jgi:hypothetical protein